MAVKTRKLYASVTATSNDLAHLDILRAGRIRMVQINITNTTAAPAAGDYVLVEVSFASTAQTATNDASGIIAMASGNVNFTTSGNGFGGSTTAIGPTAIDVRSGDRIYLNVVESGGSTWLVSVIIHVEE